MASTRDFEVTYKINGKADFTDVETSLKNMRQVMEKLTLSDKLQTQFKDLFTQATSKLDDFRKQLDSGILDARGLKKFETTGRELANILDNIAKKTQSIGTNNLPKLYSGDPADIAAAQKAIDDARKAYDTMATSAGKYRTEADAVIELLNKQKSTLNSTAPSWQNLIDAINAGQLEKFSKLLRNIERTNLKNSKDDLEAVQNAVNGLAATGSEYANSIVNAQNHLESFNLTEQQAAALLGNIQRNCQGAAQGMHDFANAQISAVSSSVAAQEAIDRLSNKIKSLLSYASGIALLRRSVRNAYNTIKELDAAMTETATVTEYSVGQMWNKLDDYTNIANKLGATTLGTYKTITLFFQQGLDEQQSLALATETMKMARVAGIDYAEATEYMTSALRGFNMELDETSATRVNDVYSELAKITAADTNQIAIAMSKVASLANSANMELETTSAFLSQIIETTQEAPETAGTALKTIIARFSEVKKLFSEGDITGSDENGDVIDVNKIGAALRNVGIDLNQYIAGNVGLDQIFLELAEKWDDLSLVQQRYIATQAAGSRQQSRFIAMMQNYSRTMELVDAAYNSAGSGQEQFEKTLESLEAKLNELHNAWNSFSMSIANSSAVKTTVDLFTTLLTVVNNLTDAFGKFSGIVKIFLGVGLFKGINSIFTAGNNPLLTFADSFKQNYNIIKAFNDASIPLKQNLASIGMTVRDSLGMATISVDELNAHLENSIKNRDIYQQQLEALKNSGDTTSIERITASLQKENAQIEVMQNRLANMSPVNQASAKLLAFGSAAVVAGQSLKYLGQQFDNKTLTKIGQWVSIIGAGSTALGVFEKVIPKVAKVLGIASTAITGFAAAMSLLVVGVTAAIVILDRWHQHTVDLYNSSDATSQKLTELTENMNSLADMKDGLKDLVQGSADWYIQLSNIKNKIDEIIKDNPEMANFLHFDGYEGFTFDEKGYEDYRKQVAQFQARQKRLEEFAKNREKDYTQYDYSGADEQTLQTYRDLQPVLNKNNPTEYDITKLRGIFNLPAFGKYSASDDQIRRYLQIAEANASNSTEQQKRDYLEKNFGITDVRNDELDNYYVDALASMLLQSLAESLQKQEYDANLHDKKGQNLYAQYYGTKQLPEQLDLGLANDNTANALYEVWQNLDDLEPKIKGHVNWLKALALETSEAMTKYMDLNDVLKDNKDILQSGVKSATDYKVALGNVYKTAKSILSDSISMDFVEENLDKFISAFVDGSETAFLELQKKIIETFNVEDYVEEQELPISINQEDFAAIQEAIAELTSDKDFILNGFADFTDIYNALMQIPGMTDEIAQKMIQALTLEAQFVPKSDGNGYQVLVSSPGLGSVRNIGAGSKNKNKSGGSKQKEKAWENPYDQLYNLTELNEEAIRRRNILEKQYNAILRDREGTQKQLTNNSLQELANLQQQLAYQRQLQAGREKQLNAVTGEMYTDSEGNRKSYADWGVTQYASYNRATNAVEIDWDAIDKVTDQTTGKAIEDYIKRLEELQKLFEETDSNILDIEEEIDEINERGKTTYLDFEQEIYDAIVNSYQKTINSFSSLNDTINEANDKIMNGLQEQIDLERQIRDNTKTEEEIGDKEARLAYLQRDTSGANAMEALRLQEEIANARQSYADSLIDQRLQQLQKDNDDAAEQRQMQITLMQEQLNYWAEQGVFWKDVDTLLQNAFDPETGELANNSALVDLLKGENNFKGLSEFGKAQWKDELVKKFMESMEGYGSWMMEKAEQEGTITQGGNTYTYDKSKKAWMLGNEAYSAVYDAASGQYVFTRTKSGDVKTGTIGEPKEEIKANTSGNGTNPSSPKKPSGEELDLSTNLYDGKRKYKISIGNWSQFIEAADEQAARNKASSYYDTYGIWYAKQRGNNYTLEQFKKQFTKDQFKNALTITRQYASGGFADFTGPAWLDGSKSKPEAVLSAKQTELFISLRDMLEKFGQTGGFNNATGNTYVDLDVNADIGSDYDVDSLVARLKRDILDSSSYRNVNMLSRGH